MQPIEQCLERIIGISNRPCDCANLDFSSEVVNESRSGLFLDDPFEGVPLFKLANTLNCDDSLLEVMLEARRQAIGEFSIDLLALMSQYNKTVMTKWTGVWGDAKQSKPYNNTKGTYTGTWFEGTKNAPAAATVRIDGIGVTINETKQVTIELYNAEDLTTPLNTWQINAIEKQESTIKFVYPGPLYLPLKDHLNRPIKYLLVYDVGSAKAMDTKYHCGCGVLPSWTKIIETGTYDENGILMPQKWTTGRSMRGLSVFGSVTCGNLWLCRDWDFITDGWARTMAKTIQYMAVFKVMQYIDNNNSLKYTVLEKREHLWGKMNHLKKEIAGRMNYLATEIPDQAWGCWECSPSQWKGSITI